MSSANADTELLTEHFGYPPVSLLDDIINSVNILAERALNSVEQALLRQPSASLGFKPAAFQPAKGSDEARLTPEAAEAAAEAAHHHEIENGTHQLETLLCASIDRNFDKFELYAMRNILCVKPEDRDWMRLAHYEGLDFDAVAADASSASAPDADPNDDAAIARLHRRLQASLKLGHLLDVETQRNEALLTRLRALAGSGGDTDPTDGTATSADADADADAASLAFLLDRGPLTESDAATPLTTTTAFALSQLPALRSLSDNLRQKAPGLAAAASDDDDKAGRAGDGKSWRRERLEYVESAARKHLERVRGLDLGRNGELRSDLGGGGGGSSSGGDSNSRGNSGGAAVEPEALTNILGILRDNHGAKSAAAAGDATEPDDSAMDET